MRGSDDIEPHYTREKTMKPVRTSFLVVAVLAADALALTGGSLEPGFLGQWVPAKASCDSPLKVVIDTSKVTFVNGTQKAEYAKLDQCFSCGGVNAPHIVVLSTDKLGDSPWMFYLDKKKKQIVEIDFSNDKKLASRFPLKGPLKRCGS